MELSETSIEKHLKEDKMNSCSDPIGVPQGNGTSPSGVVLVKQMHLEGKEIKNRTV